MKIPYSFKNAKRIATLMPNTDVAKALVMGHDSKV